MVMQSQILQAANVSNTFSIMILTPTYSTVYPVMENAELVATNSYAIHVEMLLELSTRLKDVIALMVCTMCTKIRILILNVNLVMINVHYVQNLKNVQNAKIGTKEQ